jgi:SWI/SNF-related matrix-associated actin-dependent regulator 1 of chromatin subfamily A
MTIRYRKLGFHSDKKRPWGKLTYNPYNVKPFLEECDPEARRAAKVMMGRYERSAVDSHPYQDEKLKPFQVAGVMELMKRKRVLLADEQGLGKTVQCASAIDLLEPDHTLILAPSFLVLNWAEELEKWTKGLRIQTILKGKQKVQLETKSITVLSYGLIGKYELLKGHEWGLLICDECHFLKNPKAQRTKAVRALKAKRSWMLSGTPMRNRPRDMYPVLHYLMKGFGAFHQYAKRYCDSHQTFVPGRGMCWDYDGASNEEELQVRLRSTVMIRRLKKEVLPQLPDKTHRLILLDDAEVARSEKTAMTAVPEDGSRLEEYHVATIRKNTAIAKLPETEKFVKNLLEEVEKVVVFAYHRDVMQKLGEQFVNYNPAIISGATPTKTRNQEVKRFQTDPECRVFVGQIQAAGTGLTLTASSTVVFAETTWTPSEMEQAADRCHRMGQKSSVNIYTLLTRNTIDEAVYRALQSKSLTIKKCLELARGVHGE